MSERSTLYVTDRVNGWWPGVSRRCQNCGASGMLNPEEPEGSAPGRIVCLMCSDEPYLLRRNRAARPSVFELHGLNDLCVMPGCDQIQRARAKKGLCGQHHYQAARRQEQR